ncbi:hypothetical protein [Nocardia jiangsuensis]|uniref:Uncharacterized protein n=1 Tax=Nocardia jiangsuensis TaxID=1691563 RepID=A0ABV8DLR3_9NOCA
MPLGQREHLLHARRPRPSNTAVLLRDAFTALDELAFARLAATGYGRRTAPSSSTWTTPAPP